MNNNVSNQIDISVSETKQLLAVNKDIQLISYTKYTFAIDNFKQHKYQLSANMPMSNVCIKSNMVRNNSMWYVLGNMEDHTAFKSKPIQEFDNTYSYPIFYYDNFTMIIFDDFIYLKYINHDKYYQILKQQQYYPYYMETTTELIHVIIINSSIGDIAHYIFVDIKPLLNDGDKLASCTVCDQMNNCVDCDKGIKPNCTIETCKSDDIILYITPSEHYIKWHNVSKTWGLINQYSVREYIQDLQVTPNIYNISIHRISDRVQTKHSPQKWYSKYINYIISAILFIFTIIGIFLFYYCWRNHKLRKAIALAKKHTLIVSNPMVIVIGIEWYEYDKNNPGIDEHCPTLCGIDVDWRNIKKFCEFYGYDLYPKEEQYQWNQQQIINLLQKCSREAAEG